MGHQLAGSYHIPIIHTAHSISTAITCHRIAGYCWLLQYGFVGRVSLCDIKTGSTVSAFTSNIDS